MERGCTRIGCLLPRDISTTRLIGGDVAKWRSVRASSWSRDHVVIPVVLDYQGTCCRRKTVVPRSRSLVIVRYTFDAWSGGSELPRTTNYAKLGDIPCTYRLQFMLYILFETGSRLCYVLYLSYCRPGIANTWVLWRELLNCCELQSWDLVIRTKLHVYQFTGYFRSFVHEN